MRDQGIGGIYLDEYLKILARASQAMARFPLSDMSAEERKTVVLAYAEIIEHFQGQLKAAGIRRLLDLYPDDAPPAGGRRE